MNIRTTSGAVVVIDREACSARVTMTEDSSIGEKIQHGCLICLCSEQLSWFSCLIILVCNFEKIWATAQIFWSGYKESAESHPISQSYVVWIRNEEHFSGQAAKRYIWFWDMKISFQTAYYTEWRGPQWQKKCFDQKLFPRNLNDRIGSAIHKGIQNLILTLACRQKHNSIPTGTIDGKSPEQVTYMMKQEMETRQTIMNRLGITLFSGYTK